MHWADVSAKNLLELRPNKESYTVATGITPSGPIHIGNMREILTADMICQSLRELDVKTHLIYVCDSIDPLRKVYPFLDPLEYEKYVGWPLNRIPCPCDHHENYVEHFLEPFLWVIERLGIEITIFKTHELYSQGKYYNVTKRALLNVKGIRQIIKEVSGRDLPEDWYPYNPICHECGSMQYTKVIAFEDPYVYYLCNKCGHEGRSNIKKDDGKLPWRVDWPARWCFLGVDFEPFGKDHATQGGSYDTGKRIAHEIYGISAPEYVVYEWIHLKGRGAMSSSTGTAISAHDLLVAIPAEVMRFIIARSEPKKHIDFDPGLPLLDIIDEFDRYERVYFGLEEMGGKDLEDIKRIYELSHIGSVPQHKDIVQVPIRHIVTLIQIYTDEALVIEKLIGKKPEDLPPDTLKYIKNRIECAKKWLEKFAPDNIKFSLKMSFTDINLSEEDKCYLKAYADVLRDVDWDAESIHRAVYSAAKKIGVKPPKIFRACYRAFIGADRGPRLGYFLSTLDRNFVLQRLRAEG